MICFTPSKKTDIDLIIEEFHPCPANKDGNTLVKETLNQIWEKYRFAFVWRPNFQGTLIYSNLYTILL